MPTCDGCHNDFPNRVSIDGKVRVIANRKFCLSCSPFVGIPEGERTITCGCGRTFIYSKKAGHTLTKCNSCSANSRRFELKQKAVTYKGGSCQNCGYNKCIEALDFHHRDPEQKDFSISGSHTRSWEAIKVELDKCDLICANCHREEHFRLSHNG